MKENKVMPSVHEALFREDFTMIICNLVVCWPVIEYNGTKSMGSKGNLYNSTGNGLHLGIGVWP